LAGYGYEMFDIQLNVLAIHSSDKALAEIKTPAQAQAVPA
jgi:hypothetical protein